MKFFLAHPDVPTHLREIARQVDEEINAVRRELMRLAEIKFVIATIRGNKKYFSLNPDFLFLEDISSMFFKSEGLADDLVKNKIKLGNVYFITITEAFTSPVRSVDAIDLIIIGDGINIKIVDEIIQHYENELGRDINYTVLKFSDFVLRKRRRDPFILQLLLSTQLMVIGSRRDFVNIETNS